MNPAEFVVYCPNQQCGDPVSASGIVAVESRKYRKMNYIGNVDVGFVKKAMFAFLHPNKLQPRLGEHHGYKCPVCGNEKVFVERNGAFIEIEGI